MLNGLPKLYDLEKMILNLSLNDVFTKEIICYKVFK